MASLNALRRRIDRLDESLLRLLNRRGVFVQEVRAIKEKRGQSIFSPSRERDLLRRLKAKNTGPLSDAAVEDIFREIVHVCRSLEKDLKIAYFGPEATFTHQAAVKCFGRRSQLSACRTIADVFSEVEKERVDYGVVPIENSTEGVVNHTLDMFMESELSICAELELPIRQYLLGHAATYRHGAGVRTLYVHTQALAQCRQWVEEHLPGVRMIEAASTAESARVASNDRRAVAIASRLAAELYGLDILASRIEDVADNFTRFLVIGRTQPPATGHDRTSIMFSIKDRVGALYDMLAPFRKNRLNLTKIESRPTRQRPWEYVFFVDFLGHRSEKRVQKALQQLERSCISLRTLGSYPLSE
jgi:chorismate mutase/prephenate dehydratase